MPPRVSILTVYYNTPKDLLRLHESMHRYLPADSVEWIIADNSSAENLSDKFPGAKYIRLPENLGYGKANNRAAQQASGEFLFLVNPDCLFIHDCITPLLNASVDADIFGPCVLNTDRTIQLSFGPFLSIFAEAKQKFLTKEERSDLVQKWIAQKIARPFHPDYVSGCALFVRKELFESLNGFDEDYFLYNEDVDLCFRAKEAGKKVLYVSSAGIVHERNASMNVIGARAIKEFHRSQMLFYQKHRGRLSRFALRMISAALR